MSVFIGYPSFMAYQMMKGKKDNNEGFPTIPGTIARYSALGLTNEQMKENPVWVDKTGNGHDLQMKNFAWGGMSGVGGYVDNWNSSADWAIDSYWVNSHTDHKLQFIKASSVVQARSNNIYNAENVYKNILNVNGLTEAVNKGSVEALRINAVDPITSKAIKIFSFDTDGVIQISFDDVLQDYYIAYFLSGNNTNDIDITIEQLPLYPGFILGDGVDDFAVTEKELNFEDTYTVYTAFIPFQDDPIRGMIVCGKDFKKDFYLYYSYTHLTYYTSGLHDFIPVHINQFHIIVCKRDKTNAVIKNLITGESKTFSVSELINNPGVYYLWRYYQAASYYAKAAIAGQIIDNGHFTTDEEDENILNWYKKQYPWLFPDQAWTVTGKTNEDEDRATIANITGNGNDLILSNFGFIEGSGYNEEGEYAGYLVTDGVDDKTASSIFKLGKDFTVVGEWEFLQDINNNSGLRKTSSFIIRNNASGLSLIINRTSQTTVVFNVKSLKAFCSNGLLYKNDWTEQIDTASQLVTSSNSKLLIAFRDDGVTEYDKFAFKNLAIYPMVLSKDDCIKAYNYLQTLKAK